MSKPSWLEEDRLRRIEALLERIAVALETSRIAGIAAAAHETRPSDAVIDMTITCNDCGGRNGSHFSGCYR